MGEVTGEQNIMLGVMLDVNPGLDMLMEGVTPILVGDRLAQLPAPATKTVVITIEVLNLFQRTRNVMV